MANLVLTAIGNDQAGLVEALAGVVVRHDGNWDRSQMASLAGKFAGIVMITVADSHVDALIGDLQPLEARGLLDITVERAADDPAAAAAALSAHLEITGQDQPGIVHELSAALATRNISIAELETRVESGAMAGGRIFRAEAGLVLPAGMTVEGLSDVVDDVANDLRLDIDIE